MNRVVRHAIECGLDDRIEAVTTNVRAPDSDYHRVNPLAKVPALVRDDGRLLIDSPVICEYLDTLHDGPRLVPSDPEARFAALHLQALADGIVDAAILYQNERTRRDVAAVRARPTLFAYQLLYQLVPATSGRLATPRPSTVTIP